MTVENGIPIPTTMVTGDTVNTHAIALSDEIKGGWHSVADNTARDAIPTPRLQAGMGVWVGPAATGKLYIWSGSVWVEFVQGGSITGFPPLGIQVSSVTIPAVGFGSSTDAYYHAANDSWYLPAKTASKVYKVNATSGVITTLTPPVTIGVRSGIIYSTSLAKMIVGGTSGGFCTLDPATDTFGSAVTPVNWGQTNASYDETNGWVYFNNGSTRLARCTITGATETTSSAITSTAARVLVVGVNAYVIDTIAGNSRLVKFTPASWPAIDSSLSFGVTLAQDTGLAYDPVSGKILVGGLNGNMFVVDPAAMTLSATVTLSGASAAATNAIIIDASSSRIYAQDANAKTFVIDASTYAILNFFIPSTVTASSGMVYDSAHRVLGFMTNASTLFQRILC